MTSVPLRRRLAAFLIDGLISYLTASAITGNRLQWPLSEGQGPWPLISYFVEVSFLTGLLGYSIGKKVAGFKIINREGKPIGLIRAVIRTAMVFLLIPPLVTNSDGRGLHDLAVDSKPELA